MKVLIKRKHQENVKETKKIWQKYLKEWFDTENIVLGQVP